MTTQQLSTEMNSLNETIISLISEMNYLSQNLKKNNIENEKLRFRLSELESVIGNQ